MTASEVAETLPHLGDVCQEDGSHAAVLMFTRNGEVHYLAIPEEQVSAISAVLRCMAFLVSTLHELKIAPVQVKQPKKKSKYNQFMSVALKALAQDEPMMARAERMKTAMAQYGKMQRENRVDAYLKEHGVIWDTGQLKTRPGSITIRLGD